MLNKLQTAKLNVFPYRLPSVWCLSSLCTLAPLFPSYKWWAQYDKQLFNPLKSRVQYLPQDSKAGQLSYYQLQSPALTFWPTTTT